MRIVPLFHGRELLKNGIDGGPVAGFRSDVLPHDLSVLINHEHGGTRDTFDRVQYAVLPDEILIDIRKDRESQIQLRCELLTIGGRIRTNGDHLGTETLHFRVIFLQLAELRTAKSSSLGPIENNENRLFALVRIQIDSRTLNRKPSDVRRDALNLKREQQRKN